MENRENGRMILDSVQNGPLVLPTITEDDATNIVLQGLPPDMYAIFNHHEVAKEIWDRVKLLTRNEIVIIRKEVLPPEWKDDPIAYINKAMAFLTVVASSRFSSTNNQLRTSTNLRNQATIQDGRVTVQQVQGRQFLDEEQLAFLADPGILDATLMANLFNYGSDVISEVPHYDSYHNDMDNQNFGKRFVPQQELSDEQAFWLQTSHPNTDQSASLPIKIEAPGNFLRGMAV
uniref:Integrase, catalytic region, zinc finger, CCHC-type, peptidase aspartic, catalytic n=1 Tax=Tanacetum cinerariifolium TaxID=118510 RepID=A0A699HUX0_TANCI|nr:hypothetical protein [Tanacetum cinerariifolium]